MSHLLNLVSVCLTHQIYRQFNIFWSGCLHPHCSTSFTILRFLWKSIDESQGWTICYLQVKIFTISTHPIYNNYYNILIYLLNLFFSKRYPILTSSKELIDKTRYEKVNKQTIALTGNSVVEEVCFLWLLVIYYFLF